MNKVFSIIYLFELNSNLPLVLSHCQKIHCHRLHMQQMTEKDTDMINNDLGNWMLSI